MQDALDFPPARLLRLSQLERWHFWFVARRKLLDRLLSTACPSGFARALDVGCGTGANVAVIRSHARRVACIDFRPEGLVQAAEQTRRDAHFVRGVATRLPFVSGGFDLVTVLDVLEHVDDEAALAEIRRVLRPGGALVISVPAMPWLWSYRDRDAGHRRRYQRHRLLGLIRESQFDVHWVNYFQCLLFPLVLARAVGRNTPGVRDLEETPAPLLNAVLGWISRAEVHLSRFVSWPFGSSLVAVCRKPDHEASL